MFASDNEASPAAPSPVSVALPRSAWAGSDSKHFSLSGVAGGVVGGGGCPPAPLFLQPGASGSDCSLGPSSAPREESLDNQLSTV